MKKGYFSSKSPDSIMRIGFIICVISGCFCSILVCSYPLVAMLIGKDAAFITALVGCIGAGAGVVGAVLTSAFIGKSSQKFAEIKENISNNNIEGDQK